MSTFNKIIEEICDELSIDYTYISKNWIMILSYKSQVKTISGYKFDNNTHSLGIIYDDKYATYEYLNYLNIPAVEHELIYGESFKEKYAEKFKGTTYLKKLFKKYQKDVVLKINNGACGRDVYHYKDFKELNSKYHELSKKHHALSVCPYYEALNEYRVIVLNGKVVLMYKKIKPEIIGDGKSTIKDLLIEFNQEYFDDYDDENKNKVLAKDEKYTYDWKFNLSRGAKMSFDISPKIKEDIVSTIQNFLKVTTGFVSIDIIKTTENKYYVLEVNSGIMTDNLIKENKDGYNIAKDIYKKAIQELFNIS